eukprot:gene19231-19115_t
MLRKILIFGVIGGLIAGGPMLVLTATSGTKALYEGGHLLGYATMLVALSTVFIAIKRQRDVDGGGVIRFWPAVGLGLAISLVASLFYAAAWELAMMISQDDFMAIYSAAQLAELKAKGAPPEKIAATAAEMAKWADLYKNPFIRFPMTMSEILPVGVLVTGVSAALLRNSRFLPARQAA